MKKIPKYSLLKQKLARFNKPLIAFSSGVDSTLLLKAAADTLGPENVIACIATGPLWPQIEVQNARLLANQFNVQLIELKINPLEHSKIASNPPDRCYFCKTIIFKKLRQLAKKLKCDAVLCGSNLDDLDDYRPGNLAITELDIKTPLVEADLTKNDIRKISRQLNLPTADRPASPCLASRIEYNLPLTAERLEQVDKAESFLRSLGFDNLRVRHHNNLARIEIPQSDYDALAKPQTRKKIIAALKNLGFTFVTLDLQPLRSGSLNDLLTDKQKTR